MVAYTIYTRATADGINPFMLNVCFNEQGFSEAYKVLLERLEWYKNVFKCNFSEFPVVCKILDRFISVYSWYNCFWKFQFQCPTGTQIKIQNS